MADGIGGYFRNDTLKEDSSLPKDLKKYVQQLLTRNEILSFMRRDYPSYSWSKRTLDRRLRYFGIYYSDGEISLDEVKSAVQKELNGPGKLLGYRSMQKKVRIEHGVNAPRDLVHAVMQDLDPDGLKAQALGMKTKKKKGQFTSKGANFVHSVDGHDKLMGFQNSTYPLAVYGCIDTSSRKLLWIKVWVTNSNPKIVGRWYLEYLYETTMIAAFLRMDKGTETGVMATMHAFLRNIHGDLDDASDSVIYGPSTSNQIERWWKELHERLEKYFKEHLRYLKEHRYYDPNNEHDRMLLAYVMIPLLQREVNIFKDSVWNSHRIRPQKETALPAGIPNHIYSFPEEYGMDQCGFPVTEEQLQKVAEYSGVLEVDDDFLDPAFRLKCQQLIPDVEEIEAKDCRKAYLYLKETFPA